MNQKDAVNDIKERLGEYTRLLRGIDNQYERLGLMEMTMAAPPGSSMTGMPRGSGTPSDRTDLMVMRKMELEEQIKETITEEQKERASIEAMIQQVKRPDERAVLRLRYFDRADWDGICAALYGDRQDYLDRLDSYQNRTYKAHGRALLRLAEILKDSGENDRRQTEGQTTEERPEKEGRRADNARRPFLAMKEAARGSRSRVSSRSTGNPRQQCRPTARQPDGQTATSRGRPTYKPREATTSSMAAATAAERSGEPPNTRRKKRATAPRRHLHGHAQRRKVL